ncbi:MAG: hypothetical protein LC804_22140 [Acidobacteria bacterium]|nr:hypothetical protein [Acidobacteriota bacterium]
MCADGLESTHLLVSVDPELPQKTRRLRHVGQQAFSMRPQGLVAADPGQPFVCTSGDVAEQRVARDGDLRGQAPDRLHSLGLAEPFFERNNTRDVFCDDVDRSLRGGQRLQPNDETAALPGLPGGLDCLCLARRPRSFEQPAQIAGTVERGCHEIDVPQVVDAPATE